MKRNYLLSILIVVLLVVIPSTYAQNDSDNDGVSDRQDECPQVVGTIDNNGCPVDDFAPNPTPIPEREPEVQTEPQVDTDGDGVFDSDDLCPNTVGYIEWNGCPDTDGDGLTTQYDNCPDEFGSRENLGCPDAVAIPATTIPVSLPPLPQDACYVGTFGATAVNIRPSASTDEAPIGTIDPSQAVSALGVVDGWVLLADGGYVSESVVRTNSLCTPLDDTANNSTADRPGSFTTNDEVGNYKCIYFTGLFRNTGDEAKILMIELPDALGEGSSKYIGPALVEVGDTYFADRHFLVPDSWTVPDHPEAGWNIVYQGLDTDVFDFSVVDTVNFLVTFREDCMSPQPTCYYASMTVNNPNPSATLMTFSFVLASGDVTLFVDDTNIEWFFRLEGGDVGDSYVTPAGQATHNLYWLSPWHYDENEHRGLELVPIALFDNGDVQPLEVLDTSEVEIVPIESIDHLCEANPVEVSDAGAGIADNFAPDPESMACYYFEQAFLNLTDLPVVSPEYQLIVYHRESGQAPFETYSETFSTTVFSNGDTLQYLRTAPLYALEFEPSTDYFISYRQFTLMPDGLVEAGPALFMIVDNSYCDNETMPFTHTELVETVTHECYRIKLSYENNTDSLVNISAQLTNIISNGGIGIVDTYGDAVTRTWDAGESRSHIFSFVIDAPESGYLSYTLSGADDLDGLGSFSLTYNCDLAQ
ncbi:MAG: hypothetical protein Phog2KO_21190 [Phototrophicaceae bacterium]